jgi:polyketide-type polyunsaturated fatty acid synthase PfaA
MTQPNDPRGPIAVVGVSALFPGSIDAAGFWRDILAGRDMVGPVPASHWLVEDYYDPDPKAPDKTYANRGAFLGQVPFDPMEFGIPPNIVPATDTSQLLALIVAQRVLSDATGGQFKDMDRDRVSVVLGVTSGQELLASMVSRLQKPIWQKSLREAGVPESKVQDVCQRIADHYVPWQESSFPGLLGNVVAGRIANRLDLGGTNCVTDAACASAFSAVSMAVNELHLGDADLVISGGVDTLNDIFMHMCFSKTPALSATGDCRPFSDKADGTLLGEGLGMVALKRLADAERDGDRVYAVIRGIGASSDGRAKSVYAPRSSGQAKALRRAYAAAGYGVDSVELVEAHGTATKAGDAAEFEGLRLAFDEAGREDRQWCALGSVKSQIGHTKAAAGAAGLFKVVMALNHRVLPPTIKVDRPNSALNIEQSAFYLNTEARPWIRGSAHPRRGSVSSFGFGGSNFHIACEEYRGPAKAAARLRTSADELVVFAAADAGALVATLRGVEVPEASLGRKPLLPWLAETSQRAYHHQSAVRVAIVAKDDADLRDKLATAADVIAQKPNEPFENPRGIHYGVGEAKGAVAFVFPGQGSQYVGMGAGVAMAYDAARSAWDASADVDFGEMALHHVVFPQPVFDDEARAAQRERLVDTRWAQPAIGLCSMSLLRLLDAVGMTPQMVAGHSFGEVTALLAAGVLDAEGFITAARDRGQAVAEAAKQPGAMVAVSAEIEKVRAVVDASGLPVVVANHNAPKQVVLSGATEAIDAIETKLADAGLANKRLSVSSAFHSSIVASAADAFATALEELDISAPEVPVYANATAAPYASEPAAIRAELAGQIKKPVRFVEQIEAMYAAGARLFLEVGPASVLTGLVGRILQGREHQAIALDKKGKAGLSSWHDALARLVADGRPLALGALWDAYAQGDDPRLQPTPKMMLEINGSNYGKPYPPKNGAAGLPAPNPELPQTTISAGAAPAPSTASTTEAPVTHANDNNATSTNNGQTGLAAPASQVLSQPTATYVATDGWAGAFQEAQRQTAEAHCAFQNAMAQAHVAFLQTSEAALEGMVTMATGAVAASAPRARSSFVPQQLTAAPVMVAAPMQAPIVQVPAAPVHVAPAPAPVAAPVPAPVAAPAPVAVAAPAPVPAPVAAPAPAPAPVAEAAPPVDAEALMLEVVSDKTGYPSDMLSMDMTLEADLGIDSIKRVEILSEIMKRRPDLPKVDTKKMASLNTLGEIAGYVRDHLASATGANGASEAPAPKAG